MAKEDLKQIVEHIRQGRVHIRKAKEYADKVGDKKGAEKLDKHDRDIAETHGEFMEKGE